MNATTKDQILQDAAALDAMEAISTTTSAPEIISLARKHLDRVEVCRVAFIALETFWPGYFTDANALRRLLAEIEARAAVATSPLRLVPCEINAMSEGNAYLAATFGQSGLVATVVRATEAGAAKAAEYNRLFRIEICNR